MQYTIKVLVVIIAAYSHLIIPSATQNNIQHVAQARKTAQELLIASTLKATCIIASVCEAATGEPIDLGQAYDVNIVEREGGTRIALPTKIVIRTTHKFIIDVPWRGIALDPQAECDDIDDPHWKPLAPSQLYSCISSSHEWRVVVRNEPKTDSSPARITLEVYREIIEASGHVPDTP